MIFAVNPTYEPGDYVHPVARNFEDFLRLLLACGDTAAIEQCWFMDREVFDDFLTNNPPTEEMQSYLDVIRKKYKLVPMEDPFDYMQSLHQSFDYSQLQFQIEPDMPRNAFRIVDCAQSDQLRYILVILIGLAIDRSIFTNLRARGGTSNVWTKTEAKA